jgi:hypothetical protein
MVFNALSVLYNHHFFLVPKHFHHSNRHPIYIKHLLPIPTSRSIFEYKFTQIASFPQSRGLSKAQLCFQIRLKGEKEQAVLVGSSRD